MKKAALYIRVSHEEQAMHGYSIDAQREALTQFAIKNNYYIVDYYVDEGLSARKNYKKRKDFMRMMDDVKQNKIEIILFVKLDRWFRSIKDYYDIQSVLEAHNVVWKTIFEQYDTATAAGRLHVNIMLSVAQDEADRTSERIKFVFADKIRRGEAISGALPFGLKIENKKVVPDPDKIPIIKDLFKHYLTYQGKLTTVTYAIEKYKLYLSQSTFSRMLKNTLYLGEYRGVINYCEPIIDRQTYDRIQEVVKSNIKQTKTHAIYIFTGMLICPSCGRNYASAKTKTSEHVYNYHYRCNGHYMRKICDNNKTIGEKKIEEYLLENVEKEMKSYITKYEVKQQTYTIHSSKNEREKIMRKLNKLKDLYLNDLIDRDSYKKDYDMYTQQILELQEEPKIEKPNIEALQDFLRKDIRKIYNGLSREERRILWRSVIKEIRFRPRSWKPIIYFC